MASGPGDTISVAADTLSLPVQQTEFSIGQIIPLVSPAEDIAVKDERVAGLTADYISGLKRVDGIPRASGPVNSDMSFILLSLSFLIITLLTLFGRRTVITGLSSISFRRNEENIPVGTSEVFTWPPIFRNIFSVLNINLFASTSLLVTGLVEDTLFNGSTGLTAIIAGSFLASLFLRHLSCIVIAGLTGFKSLFREYMNVIYNSWFACSILLFILNGLIHFTAVQNPLPFIIAGLIIIAIFLLIRVLVLLSIFIDRHVSIFYYILYLCALEVLPVMVILKLLGVF
ncbi:MAG: DUF4271 domain-containing protein [Bacteroidales bacterium]|jgi:hypothetical protein